MPIFSASLRGCRYANAVADVHAAVSNAQYAYLLSPSAA